MIWLETENDHIPCLNVSCILIYKVYNFLHHVGQLLFDFQINISL